MGTSISWNMAIPGKLPEIAHITKRPALCLIGPSPAFIRHRRRRDTALGPANPALRIVDEGAVAPAAFS